MSRFYEVKKRDGAARIGQLHLNDGVVRVTPLLLTFQGRPGAMDIGDELEVIPVESPRFEELSREETWRGPRGTVLLPEVHPLYVKEKEAPATLFVDFFVLAFASSMLRTPKDFVRRIIDARMEIPPDVALWVPGIATVENAALLVYMGVDIIDDTNALIKGYKGIYQLEEYEYDLSIREQEISPLPSTSQLPCTCPVCSGYSSTTGGGGVEGLRATELAKHNALLLEREVRKIREYIRAGILREYVEMRVRSSSFLTAVLRLLDTDTEREYFERRTPVARKQVMRVNTMESLRRIEVKRFASRVLERYRPPSEAGRRGSQILLILPCSARKPYSSSQSHKKFIDAIKDYRGHIHELILTSPLGVVPRELELVYPAAFYEIPVTGYWDAEEREWVSSCLRAYLERNRGSYEAIVVHLRLDSGYGAICRAAVEDLEPDMEVIYTCKEHEEEYSQAALERLRSCIAGLCGTEARLPVHDLRVRMLRAMADYQFGPGTGAELVKGGERITGKYPHFVLSSTEGVLARIVPEYGLIALTVRGARRIERVIRDRYRVEIGDFVPRGSILAPGVVNAGEEIRENDEVIFHGAKAFGVGRAKMSGWEMVASRRGVAVNVREVVKQ